jgi:hypothetical protein
MTAEEFPRVAHLSARENAILAVELDEFNPYYPAAASETSESVPSAAHSWHSIDLVAAAATPPEPPSIAGLLYPGKRTLFSGETESLKTWLALIIAKAEIDAGIRAIHCRLDLHC